jgi:hypothetical protein
MPMGLKFLSAQGPLHKVKSKTIKNITIKAFFKFLNFFLNEFFNSLVLSQHIFATYF